MQILFDKIGQLLNTIQIKQIWEKMNVISILYANCKMLQSWITIQIERMNYLQISEYTERMNSDIFA